ncbi:MAG: glycosyltransferase family 39 protein [Isosphaeraceae bacterium]
MTDTLEQDLRTAQGGWRLALLVVLSVVVRLVGLDQPIVENYVGRQIPTAMVARNLERGSGFLHPQLDTAPLPNEFLVEPPVYAWLTVRLRHATNLSLEAAGRAVSAIGIGLAVWGVHGLVGRRSGERAGLLAALLLASFPITLRYGRAFQPDSLMLGCLVAGLDSWERAIQYHSRGRMIVALILVSCGLALKVISAYLLVPLVIVIGHRNRRRTLLWAGWALVPAGLWYLHAMSQAASGAGSHASLDNGAIWASAFNPLALLRREVLIHVARFLGVRAFGPITPWLALAGFLYVGLRSREAWLWSVWGGATLAVMAVLASKLHHEYYWLTVAPVVAAGSSLSLDRLVRWSRGGRVVSGFLLIACLALDGYFARSTWRTPDEWQSLDAAARVVRQRTHAGDWIAAPEALLYAADRRGCRVEYTSSAARRAAGEWRGRASEPMLDAVREPIDLIEFYRRQGAVAFADVVPPSSAIEPERVVLHDGIRRRYNVLIDRAGILYAELVDFRETIRDAARP